MTLSESAQGKVTVSWWVSESGKIGSWHVSEIGDRLALTKLFFLCKTHLNNYN